MAGSWVITPQTWVDGEVKIGYEQELFERGFVQSFFVDNFNYRPLILPFNWYICCIGSPIQKECE